jgi:NADH-quinone oxidoreductase subunit E
MLTDDEKREIEAAASRFPRRSAAALEALLVLRTSRGWVPEEGLREIAATLGMTIDELDSVATFYTQVFHKETGRHVILVCDSISCWVTGAESVLAHLQKKLAIGPGQTTGDGRFTLIPSVCLGACDKAPAMLVDGRLYGNLTPERIDEILDEQH